MSWNPNTPDITKSVKANSAPMISNNQYIEQKMGNEVVGTNTLTTRDHFWSVGATIDGRHRFIQSPAFTVGAIPTDPVVGSGMDGVLYLKTTNTRAEWFHRNSSGIYQAVPSFLQGTVAVPTSSFTNVVEVPPNVYGEIIMFTTALGNDSGVSGFFRSNATIVESWSLVQSDGSGSTDSTPLKFASGSDATTRFILARRSDAGSATWNYRITYRAI